MSVAWTAISEDRLPVVVDAVRTPFVHSGGAYAELRNFELGAVPLRAVLARTGLAAGDIGMVTLGCVVQDVEATNVAREAMLTAGYPSLTPASTVSMAGISPEASVAGLCDMIALGRLDFAVGGGTENFSDLPIRMSRNVRKRAVKLGAARTTRDRLRIVAGLRPWDLIPEVPSSKDLTTGLTMGAACEAMAGRFGVTREAADTYAERSHHRAAAAWDAGWFDEEVVPVEAPDGRMVTQDDGIRADTSVDRLARLKPAFDPANGIITAGNASGLTDGATALLLASAGAADRRGLTARAIVRDYEFTGVADMASEMLMGPAVAIPRLLRRQGLTPADIAAFEVHEAFAVQILANQAGLADADYAQTVADLAAPIGEIPLDKLNIHGGSLALGNPFAATGGRLIATAIRRIRASGERYAVIATCAGGGLGAAMLLENPAAT
ncbi:thiolase family protein [Spectribacter hydrogenoxidans]|uniref:Thiolase family protein n=1 Tax=Spectribacter hydrogenoxidans TaxID=3075608 RepID=A0ABU3BZA2_9GAMM|nr:thiolase family protein [Salinisphaera sp. W335]MDT0634600.1 thiolase family protein [Salinisphaera sp. W335]